MVKYTISGNNNSDGSQSKASGGNKISTAGQFAQKSVVYIIGNLLEKASQLLLIPLYTRLLPPEEYGFYGAAVALCGVVIPLIDLGISSSLMRFIYEYYDKPAKLLGYLKLSFWLRIISSLISAAVCFLLLFLLWNWLFSEKSIDRFNVIWIILFGLGSTLTDFVCSYFRATSQAIWFVVIKVGQTALQCIFVLFALFFTRKTAASVLEAQALGVLLAGYLVMGIFYFKTFSKVGVIKTNKEDLRHNLSYGIPLIPHLLGNWLRSASDRVILGKFVSLTNVGLYQLSVSIGNVLSIFVYCIDLAYSPMYYRIRTVKGKGAIEVLRSFNACYICIMGILTLSISFFSGEIISILAPVKYRYAAHLIPLILYSIFLQAQYTIVVKPLFFHKKTKIIPALTLTPGVAGVIANFLLLPILGFMTVVWVNLAVYLITFISVFIVSNRVESVGYPLKLGFISNLVIAIIAIYLTYNAMPPWEFKSVVIRSSIILSMSVLIWFSVLRKQLFYLKRNF